MNAHGIFSKLSNEEYREISHIRCKAKLSEKHLTHKEILVINNLTRLLKGKSRQGSYSDKPEWVTVIIGDLQNYSTFIQVYKITASEGWMLSITNSYSGHVEESERYKFREIQDLVFWCISNLKPVEFKKIK